MERIVFLGYSVPYGARWALLVKVILNYETDQPNDLNEISEVTRHKFEY